MHRKSVAIIYETSSVKHDPCPHGHGVEATFVWISIVESLGASNHDRGIRGAIEGHNLPSGQVGPAEDSSGPTDEPGSAARGALDHAR